MSARWISDARQRASRRYAEVHADLRAAPPKRRTASLGKRANKLELSAEFRQRATRDLAGDRA